MQAIVTTDDGTVYTQIKNVPAGGFARGGRYIMGLNDLKSNKWGGTPATAKADAAYSGGDGTEANPYLLASAEDFAQFAVNGKEFSKGKFFHLTTDINLAGNSWTPITEFFGNFDGKGHTISNLNVDISSKGGGAGLFAYIRGTATIANLHIIAGTVKTNDDGGSGLNNYAGGICGYSGGTCTISGCSFSGSVTGAMSGGICGAVSAGYVDDSELTITACRNTGSVTGKSSSGGILGQIEKYAVAKITACYNDGEIALSGNADDATKLGGIMTSNGEGTNATVTACYNTCKNANLPNILYGKGTVTDCYAVEQNDDGENEWKAILFSATRPSVDTNVAWTVATNAPGSENQYWQSLGEKDTANYPKLWWEKKE